MSLRNPILVTLSLLALGGRLSASGGGDGVRMRVKDETAPPGGAVQMKLMTTEVTPISGGRPGFSVNGALFAGVGGFSLFNPGGEAAGAAVTDGSRVQVSYVTTAAQTDGYPVMMVVLPIRPDAAVGARTLFTFDAQSTWTLWDTGPTLARITPGTVTVGGSLSITDVVPGEGLLPAGTVVSVRGLGFSSLTQLRVDAPIGKDVRLVSPGELQFRLTEATDITGLRIRASNPDGFTATYYAYMRALATTLSARALLAATEPIFGVRPRAVVTLPALPALAGGQYAAVALQNPSPDDVVIDLSVDAPDGSSTYITTRTLESRHRLALEASELLDGIVPPAGASIRIEASAPIDAISLLCDEGTGTVWPSLPLEAQR